MLGYHLLTSFSAYMLTIEGLIPHIYGIVVFKRLDQYTGNVHFLVFKIYY